MQGITAPNTTLGQDMTRAVINNLYYDNVINTVVGDTSNGETIIAFDPNAVRFVSFSENVGMFATELSGPQDLQRMFMSGPTNRIKGVIIDPDYGIAWDFNAKFDPDWWPRSIVLEDAESAPKVALLYATTEGFLNIPVIGRKLVPQLRAESPD